MKGKGIVVRKRSWHAWAYFFGRWLINRFFCDVKRDSISDVAKNAQVGNLCPYMRTVMIWMPLLVAMQIGLWVYGGYVLLYAPIHYFGLVTIGKFVGVVVGAIVVVCLVGLLLYLLFNEEGGWAWCVSEALSYKMEAKSKERRRKAKAAPKQPAGAGFQELLATFNRVHDTVCPPVCFIEDEPTGNEGSAS